MSTALLRGRIGSARLAPLASLGGILAVLVLVLVLGWWPLTAPAQQAQVRVGAGPHYVGFPVDIQVVAVGFERDPQPELKLPDVAGARLELVSVSPNVNTSIQIVNGQVSRDETVTFVYQLRLHAGEPGRVGAGALVLTQGQTRATARIPELEIAVLPQGGEQRFVLALPDRPLWVGERVPVSVQWWLTEAFAERLASRRAEVPLFEMVDRFSFDSPSVGGARNTLVVVTAGTEVELPATLSRERWQGEDYLVLNAERIMVPLKPGLVEVPPATMVVTETIRWRRDFFGTRRPAAVRRVGVSDEPRTLEVKAPPAAGRPPGFAGAVGQGFSLEVSADRSVVQTGDPIRLTITVRGDGPLDTLALPDLAASGLGARGFSLPASLPSGQVEDGAKRFEAVLRVTDADVREIPALSFSWFDPETSRYETTRSRPVAVSVRAAEVVSAADVVRASEEEGRAGSAQEPPLAGTESAAGEARVTDPRAGARSARPLFTTSGADLSIQADPTALAASAVAWYARPPTLVTLHVLGLLGVAAGVAARRRAQADPKAVTRRRALVELRRSLAAAGGPGEVADCLRRMAATVAPAPRDDFDAVLAACDNLAYAPGATSGTASGTAPGTASYTVSSAAGMVPALRERALAVADRMLEQVR